MTRLLLLSRLAAVVLISAGAPAHAGLLTFEEFVDSAILAETIGTDGKVIRTGKISRLEGTIDGVEIDIFRRGSQPFDIINNDVQRPKAVAGDTLTNGLWGSRSLDPFVSFNAGYTSSQPFVITFSEPQKIVSVIVGDYGGDNGAADILNLRGYASADGSGGPIVTTSDSLPYIPPANVGDPGVWNQKRITVVAPAGQTISAVEILGGYGSYTGYTDLMSVFVDRVFYTDEALAPNQTLSDLFLAERVDDETYNGNSLLGGSNEPIPTPLPEPTTAMFTLLAAAMLARRR